MSDSAIESLDLFMRSYENRRGMILQEMAQQDRDLQHLAKQVEELEAKKAAVVASLAHREEQRKSVEKLLEERTTEFGDMVSNVKALMRKTNRTAGTLLGRT